jgi:hypothetical protein
MIELLWWLWLKLHQIHDKVELLFDNIEAENDKSRKGRYKGH